MGEKKTRQLPDSREECHVLIYQLIEITEGLILQVEKLRDENRALKERLYPSPLKVLEKD